MRLNHSGLTVCVLAMLSDVPKKAFANPPTSDRGPMVPNERSVRADAPDMHPRGAHSAATGSCPHRGQADGTPHRKVRIQHNKAHIQQKMASASTGDQKGDETPVNPAKTEDTNNQKDEPSQLHSENAAPSPTGAVSTNQNADTSKTNSEVPSVQVPALKQGQRAGKSIDSDAVTSEMKKQLVELHNKLRTTNGAGEVQWDDKIAQYSAGWMKNCIWEHSHGDGYGENLGATTADSVSATDMLRGWANEQSKFQCKKPSPEEFAGVGHYTSMMWKDVQYVGCSMQKCSSISGLYDKESYIWSCNYWPPGNMASIDPKVDNYAIKVPCSKNLPAELEEPKEHGKS